MTWEKPILEIWMPVKVCHKWSVFAIDGKIVEKNGQNFLFSEPSSKNRVKNVFFLIAI